MLFAHATKRLAQVAPLVMSLAPWASRRQLCAADALKAESWFTIMQTCGVGGMASHSRTADFARVDVVEPIAHLRCGSRTKMDAACEDVPGAARAPYRAETRVSAPRSTYESPWSPWGESSPFTPT